MTFAISIERISSDDRAEDIFRTLCPNAPAVPSVHEIVTVRHERDRETARSRLLADLEQAAPGEWQDYLAVREADDG